MKSWLIYDKVQYERNQWFASELISAASRHGAEMELIMAEELSFGSEFCYKGEPVGLPDFVMNRTIFPLLSRCLEDRGVRVFNSAEVSRICNDKRLTYERFIGTDVPVLPTVFCDRRFLPESFGDGIAYPLILKSAAGHGGSEVFMIRDGRSLAETVAGLRDHEFLLQKVCGSPGRDLRVYVLGGEIVGAALRESDSWRSNFSLGGSVSAHELTAAERRLTERVMELLGHRLDFAGIDLLIDGDRLWFNEIEDVVGSRMLYKAYGMDVADMLAAYVVREAVRGTK